MRFMFLSFRFRTLRHLNGAFNRVCGADRSAQSSIREHGHFNGVQIKQGLSSDNNTKMEENGINRTFKE